MALAAALVAALPAVAHAAFPGADGRLAFQRGAPGDLFSIAPGGGAVGPLIRGSRLLSDVMYSPDGTRIAFSVAASSRSPVEIAVANADGSAMRVLTRQRGFCLGAAWSPDGTRLAYSTDEGAPPPRRRDALPPRLRVHVINADGTGDRRLLSADRDVIDPVFSPDGTRIAFMAARPAGRFAHNRIWVANADGTGARPVTPAGGSNEQNASWSPDGTRIALELAPVRPGGRRSDLAIMNADGTGLHRVAATRWWETNPIWSPDGTRLAFTSDRDTRPRNGDRLGPGFELYTVGIDGTDVRRLTRNHTPELFPDWQPLPR
jgi:TolB protein